MRLEELNWMDVETYLKQNDRLIFVVGACEQHGYLSLLSDVKIPQALADAASQQTNVLISPAVNMGVSPYFLAYPGTISLRATTFLDLVEDMVRSVYMQGFRRLLFLNGHGGNDLARARLGEVANELEGICIRWYSWWSSASVEEIARKYEIKPSHANWLEAFPFTQVTQLPTGEKIPPKVPGLVGSSEGRMVYGDGSFGGAYQVKTEILDEIFQACLMDILDQLKFE